MASNDTAAGSIVRSSDSRALTCLPPSEPGAVLPSSTRPVSAFSKAELERLVISLTSLIVALQSNVLSGDVWALAWMGAMDLAEKHGVPNEEFVVLCAQIEMLRALMRRRNPMSGMF